MPVDHVRLTTLTMGGGCASKISQAELLHLVGGLPVPTRHHDELVGVGDDAAVWRLRDDLALVLTADFFAPVVDSPEDYGAVAATNALSDVYAMGGTPLCALNLVAWPGEDVLDPSVLSRVLAAGAEVVAAAGAAVVGGHSVRDAEPKYGLAVVGTVHPDRILTTAAGRPGDVLLLTKPLGTGVVANAMRAGEVPPATAAACVGSMRHLNARAATAALEHGVRCATDVTGFGLLGHARTIALASGCAVEIKGTELPALPGVDELIAVGRIPGGSRRNRAFADTWTAWAATVTDMQRVLATDAQTSGGLLLAVAQTRARALGEALVASGCGAWTVGRLCDAPPNPPLRVV